MSEAELREFLQWACKTGAAIQFDTHNGWPTAHVFYGDDIHEAMGDSPEEALAKAWKEVKQATEGAAI